MPILHFIVYITIVALLLVLFSGLAWYAVAAGYAISLLIVIALYRR